jgi:hypothetical protein
MSDRAAPPEAPAIEKLASELYWKLESIAPNEERVGGIDWMKNKCTVTQSSMFCFSKKNWIWCLNEFTSANKISWGVSKISE